MSLDSIVPLILEYRYWILIPLTFIEGPIVGFLTGALARLGYFDPYIAFSIFIVRDMLVDALWYWVGAYGGRTRLAAWFLKKINITDEDLRGVRVLWDTKGLRTMLVAKLSYGIAQIFLAVAGMVRMDFKRFFYLAFSAALIEYGGLFLLGFALGGAFGDFSGLVSNIHWFVAIAALIISSYYALTFYMRKRARAEEHEAAEHAN